VALAPGKQLPMQAFMLWMSGNSVQIFSVAITAMLMFSPIKALLSMSQGNSLIHFVFNTDRMPNIQKHDHVKRDSSYSKKTFITPMHSITQQQQQ
jgi:hypothetical protein